MSLLTRAAVAWLALAGRVASGQGVTISVGIYTPTPYLADWAAKPGMGGLTVSNSTGFPVDVTVQATLYRGRTQIVGQTGSDITQLPATAAQFYTLPQIARWEQMSFTGSVGQTVKQTGRLPEGAYDLCVLFSNMTENGNPLNDAQSCTPFTISFPQPPKLLVPANGSSVITPYPTFQWTPVITPQVPQVGYRIRIAEVLPGQTPQQALVANVPVLELQVLTLTMVTYPPASYPLEAGKTYAWRVQATKPITEFGQPYEPVGGNNGLSEIFTFKKAAPGPTVAIAPPTGPPPPPPGSGGGYAYSPPVFNRSLTGRIDYTMVRELVPAAARLAPFTALIYPAMQTGPGGTPPPPTLPVGGLTTGTGGGSYTVVPGLPTGAPLAGITVRLVVRYRSGTAPVNAASVHVGAKTYDDVGKVLATATTDAEGHFAFAFHDDGPTGQIAFFQPISWGSGDIGQHVEAQGTLFRYYNVDVEDAHYLSPSDELTVPASGQAQVGKLVSLARVYRLVVLAVDAVSKDTLTGVTVRLVRRHRPATVPKYEGNNGVPRPLDTAFVYGLPVLGEVVADSATGNDGAVSFARVVKSAGGSDAYVVRAFTPTNQPGLYYWPVSVGYAETWAFKPGGGFTQKIDNAHYNEQYGQFTDTLVLHLQPRPPRVAGLVARADTGTGIPNGVILLMRGTQIAGLRALQPKDSGHFAFENLAPNPQGPNYFVGAAASGFTAETKDAGRLPLGHQWYGEWLLAPDARIRVRFKNEVGEVVAAGIKIGGGPLIASRPMDYKSSGGGGNIVLYLPTAMGVDTFATSGTGLPVHIEAEPGHFPLDTTLTLHKGLNDLGTIVLKRRLHRVIVRVVRGSATSALSLPGAPPVPGAHVQLDLAQQSEGTQGTTSGNGTVLLWWKSVGEGGAGDSTANVFVTGPSNEDWVAQGRGCTAPETATPPTCTVHLRPASRISGTVYQGAGTDQPLGGARVSLPEYDGIEALTNGQGSYVLRNVPRWVKAVRAGKAGSGLTGDEVAVNLTSAAVTGVDLHLKAGVGLTTVYGFPLEIASSAPAPGGDGYIVSGAVAAAANPGYAPVDAGGSPLPGVALAFDQAHIRPKSDDSTAGVPDGDALALAAADLPLGLLGSYRAVQRGPVSQLVIREQGGTGAVLGPVELLRQESFQGTTSTGLSFVDAQGNDAPLFLLQPGASGAARTQLATLTAGAASPIPSSGLNVGTSSGGAAHFRLAAKQGTTGFPVDADPAQSFVRADGVHFRATLHTAIAGLGDLQLLVPTLLLKPGGGGVVGSSDDTVKAQLDQWTLKVPSWSLTDAGVHFAAGEIRAPIIAGKPSTAVVFPFTGMELLPTGFQGGTIQSNAVTLGGVVTLAPDGPLTFTREGTGPWKLFAQGGTISGLPGWRSSDVITLDNWSLRSNGDNHFTTAPTTLRLYNTADFAVTGLGVSDGTVAFTGSLDLLAPAEGHIPALGLNLYYTKNAQGQLTFGMDKAGWAEMEIGGAYLLISDGKLDPTGFHAGGHIRVPGYFTVPTNFSRTPLNGSNKIEAVPTPDATIPIGDIALTQVTGGAKLASPWSTAFQSLLNLPNELNGPVSFNVGGTGVTVGTAGLSVKNLSTPFGNMAITVNMPEQRLEGSVELNQQLAAGATATGTAQLAISGKPSNRYWYFFAGANFQLSNPVLGGTAALLIGNATLSGDLLSTFGSYSTKGVPPSFYTIKGFFLDGKVIVPVPVCPNGGVDVGVASVAVWCDVWGDVRLGMNFNEQNVYHVGLQAGADVGAKGAFSLGACVSVSGKASYEQGAEGEYRSDGAWYVLGDAAFTLHGEVEYGVGAFGVCLSKSKGFNLGLGAEAQMGHNWNTGKGPHFSVYWQ